MTPKRSPLNLIDFAIIRSKTEIISPIDPNTELQEHYSNYEIDLDFVIKENESGISVFVKTNINPKGETQRPGYEIFVEGAGLFTINRDGLSENDIRNLKFYSSLSIVINGIRNYISTLTSMGPFRKFTFPSIDVGDLHKQKSENTKKKKSKKETK